jgi:hypothetical protein
MQIEIRKRDGTTVTKIISREQLTADELQTLVYPLKRKLVRYNRAQCFAQIFGINAGNSI